jgi:hypothetical protein
MQWSDFEGLSSQLVRSSHAFNHNNCQEGPNNIRLGCERGQSRAERVARFAWNSM